MGNSASFGLLKKMDKSVAGGAKPTEAEIRQLFALYDKNKDGTLQREEAMVLSNELVNLTITKLKTKMEEAKRALAGLPRELRAAMGGLTELGSAMVDEVAKHKDDLAEQLYQQADVNHDGLIDLEEFVRIVNHLGEDKIDLSQPTSTVQMDDDISVKRIEKPAAPAPAPAPASGEDVALF
ncbi:hypothetical protein PAPYR_7501 [Paratrimastix pyriformis]|uniref:EF-hand domain-containing protein n=1 Tax=Paratrimastix pyriformis TaxID=342808 RepID=A0ABQ8UCX7_9EUKA|nr:hypothetical protein PAPYR_7501 [Paratrimastix pyriformis]